MSGAPVEPTAPAVQLAIVIPAFKRRFLAEALGSLARQTDQRFHVYVCDDGSPEPLRDIAEAALPPERLTYQRFEQNAGARHVVQHWNRSVRSTAEPWVWLFSDDDVMEPGCVETFLAEERADPTTRNVFRFNTLTIDAAGTVIRINAPHPPEETAAEFAYHRLVNHRLSFAPEHVFRRSAFDRAGGFVELPFGLGSDDASWITFTGECPLRTLAGPRVHWRLSGINISSPGKDDAIEKEKAYLGYAAWLMRRFTGCSPLPGGERTNIDLAEIARHWSLDHLHKYGGTFSWRAIREISALGKTQLGWPRARVGLVMLGVNVRRVLGILKWALLRR